MLPSFTTRIPPIFTEAACIKIEFEIVLSVQLQMSYNTVWEVRRTQKVTVYRHTGYKQVAEETKMENIDSKDLFKTFLWIIHFQEVE